MGNMLTGSVVICTDCFICHGGLDGWGVRAGSRFLGL